LRLKLVQERRRHDEGREGGHDKKEEGQVDHPPTSRGTKTVSRAVGSN
jgi:hypothetical protein